MKGWIKSFRKAQYHEIWRDQNAWRVFQWILWNVDYETGKGTFGKRQIARGTYLKESTVYKVTTRLREKYLAIGMKSNHVFTEISVLNWARYQQDDPIVTASVTKKEPHTVAESNTIKEYKNNKEYKRDIASLNYLKNIPLEDISEYTKMCSATESQIRNKGAELLDYCNAHGKKYKDYRAILRNALRRDFPKTNSFPLSEGYRRAV